MLLFILGTRPELIKIGPIILELRKRQVSRYLVINTGQHKELLDRYWKIFDIRPDYNLDLILPGQDLSTLTYRAIDKLNTLMYEVKLKYGAPTFIISQGDTTTVLAASIVAFYHSINFAHIEAGLRSFDLAQPFPEEYNRKVASLSAKWHFAPTEIAKSNLIRENIDSGQIVVVGNTAIDAINIIMKSNEIKNLVFNDVRLNSFVNEKGKIVIITCHRRENQNQNLKSIISAVESIARNRKDLKFVWPVHANPNVKDIVLDSSLSTMENVFLTEALEYAEIIKLLINSFKVLTDSGGLQEEAPSFKVPVLVLREKTERPEAVLAGYSRLVGANKDTIIDCFYNFNPVFSDDFTNPYGDGDASIKIIDRLLLNNVIN